MSYSNRSQEGFEPSVDWNGESVDALLGEYELGEALKLEDPDFSGDEAGYIISELSRDRSSERAVELLDENNINERENVLRVGTVLSRIKRGGANELELQDAFELYITAADSREERRKRKREKIEFSYSERLKQ